MAVLLSARSYRETAHYAHSRLTREPSSCTTEGKPSWSLPWSWFLAQSQRILQAIKVTLQTNMWTLLELSLSEPWLPKMDGKEDKVTALQYLVSWNLRMERHLFFSNFLGKLEIPFSYKFRDIESPWLSLLAISSQANLTISMEKPWGLSLRNLALATHFHFTTSRIH